MLRISSDNANDGRVTLRLEGEISGPWVDEASRLCETIIANGQQLRIDLADVTFADRTGVELLGKLRARQAMLDHCSPFLTAQLQLTANVTGD